MDIKKDLEKLNDLLEKLNELGEMTKKLKERDDEIVDILNGLKQEDLSYINSGNIAILKMLEKDDDFERKLETIKFFNVAFLSTCERLGIIKIIKK